MNSFSSTSQKRLGELDLRLQTVLNEAIKLRDFSIIEGYRGEDRQNRMYREGKSKLKWPHSKHNTTPSRAVDIAPYPIDWGDLDEFRYLAGLVVGIGHALNVPLKWGGDWDQDGVLSNNRFNDLPHIEIVE